MFDIWLIVSNLAGVIGIAGLWGLKPSSPETLKFALIIPVITASIVNTLWNNRKKFSVKGFYPCFDDSSKVAYLLIPNAKKLRMDTMVSVYMLYEDKIELVAIGVLAANENEKLIQVNIKHSNEDLLSKIIINRDLMKVSYVRDFIRFSEKTQVEKWEAR